MFPTLVLQRQQRATVAVRGSSIQILPRTGSPGPEKKREEEQKKEKERNEAERHEELQLLQSRCEEQARQLQDLHTELKKTSLGLEVFVICTQHFSLKVFYCRYHHHVNITFSFICDRIIRSWAYSDSFLLLPLYTF